MFTNGCVFLICVASIFASEWCTHDGAMGEAGRKHKEWAIKSEDTNS